MHLIPLPPRKSLNKAFLKVKPLRSAIELFKKNLIGLLDGLNEEETEEHNKNDLCDFLKNTFYAPGFYLNTKGRNDLVIHSGADSKSLPAVLVEVKKPGNRSEKVQKENLNAKAFHELILYYLRERVSNGNLEIKHLIATNVYEWFIFDATTFEKLFAQNKSFVKQFTDFEEGRLSGTTTDFFYHSIAEPFLNSLSGEIPFTWFDFRQYDAPLRNNDKTDDAKLIALFKILSPEHLLKLPFSNDSNSLDKAFYSELLHIIGLTETKSGGKKLIGRKPEGSRNPGSLLENAILQIDTRDKVSRLPKPAQFGETRDEQLFNVALELVITWLNRILFLKLLEAQLISYHRGDPEYGFLNTSRISGFDALDNLFFRVLARKTSERDPVMTKAFSKVPYLNSSLFEPTELEHQVIFISNLEDIAQVPIASSTVLKDNTGKKRSGNLGGLQYLFEFLDSYDFAGEGSEEIQEENKTLINASVLGLIFEKLNGYKDGSFFTPGFITMYMCRETIRRAVVQKFNDLKGWNCEDITGIYNRIEDIREANQIVNSLKICDPAVGSGHFLVSALNEIIAIKSDLRILSDKEGKRLKEYQVDVVNDELIITDEDGKFFEYNPSSRESQRIQEAIFREKHTIIENCLFGVDINPNSVKICRLRLWIELLKSAYYKTNSPVHQLTSSPTELETLPNIDINIKCGNSLISRYALDADIRQALKSSKWSIESYRLAVMSYRNAQSKEQKREMEQLISKIKNDFQTEIGRNDPLIRKIDKLASELYHRFTGNFLFEPEADYGDEKLKNRRLEEQRKIEEEISKLTAKVEEVKNNKIYENAFEWRFEFPEVLNDEGDFVGFDVVIGNPPYIRTMDIPENHKSFYWNEFISFEKKADIYCCFIELGTRVLKIQSGLLSFIISNGWLRLDSFEKLRKLILNRATINTVIEFTDFVFDEASVNTCILHLQNKPQNQNKMNVTVIPYRLFAKKNFHFKRIDQFEFEKTYKNIFDLSIDLLSAQIKKKILSGSFPLSSHFELSFGLKTGDDERFLSKQQVNTNYKKLLRGEDIHRYHYSFKGEYVNYLPEIMKIHRKTARPGSSKRFEQPKILIRDTGQKFESMYDNEEFYVKDVIVVTHLDKNETILKQLLAILNSRLMKYYYETSFPTLHVQRDEVASLPIKFHENGSLLAKIIDEILSLKKSNPNADTEKQETEIDRFVYELYGLTEDEIKVIEGEISEKP